MNLIPRKFYLDDIFDDFTISKSDNMKCDIYELEGDYHIEMDIPGFDKKDISIESKNGYLTVTAEKNSENNEDNKNYIRRERSYGKYQRQFYMGDIEEEQIKAEFNNGILKVIAPKKEEIITKKKIEIE